MPDNDNGSTATAGSAEERKRFRSEIVFPYADLQSAVELAQTINDRAGSSADNEELAVWMGQTASGGTFRTRIGAAKMFGLIETGQGRATLTQLGRDVLEKSDKSHASRIGAFLNVELFQAMYNQFKGGLLPPPPAIERQVVELGVSPKQKERARQTFMKSATYAGFIDPSSGRFIKPGIREEAPKNEKVDEGKERKRGSDGNEPPIDPIIAGLLARLPKSGDVWPVTERKLWLQLLEGSFQLIYKDAAEKLSPPPGDADYRKAHGMPPHPEAKGSIFD